MIICKNRMGKKDNERGETKKFSRSPLVRLGCTCLPVQFVVFISFPRERSMYSAVHMCGTFPAIRIDKQRLSVQGPDQKQARLNRFSPFGVIISSNIVNDISNLLRY